MEPSYARDLLRSSTHGSSDAGHDGVEIVHSREDWIELISSQATESSLAELGVGPCRRQLWVSELVEAEMRENLDVLQHHMRPEILNAIAEERGVAGAAGRGGGGRRDGRGVKVQMMRDGAARDGSRGAGRRQVRRGWRRRLREAKRAGRRRGEGLETLSYTYDRYVSLRTKH